MKQFSHIPVLGTGVGYRREISESTSEHKDQIEVFEVIAERSFSPDARARLKSSCGDRPIILHGVELSIGSDEELDRSHMRELKIACRELGTPFFSDHFAITKLGGYSIGHLSPLWFTQEQLELVVDRVRRVQDHLELPLVLENITSMFSIPAADYSETEFIAKVSDLTGCGLHLDIANVLINAHNAKNDPMDFLKSFPLDRVIQIHLAGGTMFDGWFFDSHSENISGENEGVWPLFEWVLERASNLRATIIERDENFSGTFEDILGRDLARARGLMEKNGKSSISKASSKIARD